MNPDLVCLPQEGVFAADVLLHEEAPLVTLHHRLFQVLPGGGQPGLRGLERGSSLREALGRLLQLALGAREQLVELRGRRETRGRGTRERMVMRMRGRRKYYIDRRQLDCVQYLRT